MSVQLSVVSDQHGIPRGIPAQVDQDPLSTRSTLERWHVALCASIASDLKGRAETLQNSTQPRDWQLCQTERDRAVLWLDLSTRISDATAARDPEAPAIRFTARDVELVRWFRLIQLRQFARTMPRALYDQRCKQCDRLFYAVYSALLPRERATVNREMLP